MADFNLFDIPSDSPQGVSAYGQAGFSAVPIGAIRIRRGFDFELGLEMEAHLSAEVRQLFVATLSSGVTGKLGLQAQVEFPLDLFGPEGGGFAARMRAQAEAAGYLRLEVGLDLAVLAELLRGVTPTPAIRMVSIFLGHVDIRAGVWAHAGVSAQLDAEAYMTGTLWPPDQAGFTCKVRFALGFEYGYGFDFIANFVIRDPGTLLRRLSDCLSQMVLDEAKRYVASLPETDPRTRPAAAALPYLELLLPTFSRCLFQIGVQLADDRKAANHREDATAAIVGAFLHESQSLVLRAVADAVLGRIAMAFPMNVMLQKVAGLTDDQKSQVIVDVVMLRNTFWSLSAEGLSVHEVLDRVAYCVGPLQDLVELGVFDGDREALLEAAGLLWTATALAAHIAGWVEDAVDEDQPGASPAPIPLPNGPIAAWVAARAGVNHAGTALTVDDLVACLVNSAGQLDPHLGGNLAEPLTWLRTVLGGSTGELFSTLFNGQPPDADAATQILTRLAQMSAQLVNERVMPDLLNDVRDAMDPDLRRIFDDTISPVVAAVPAVILPRIAGLGTPEESRRLRETASVILLQTFNELVLDSTDLLLNRGLDEGSSLAFQASNAVHEFGEADPAYSIIAATAAGAATGIDILPEDAVDLLRLAGRSMLLWNDEQREPTITILRAITRFHLGTGAGRDAAYAGLLGADVAVFVNDLTEGLLALTRGAWSIVEQTWLDLFLLGPRHHLHQVELLGRILNTAAIEAVKTINGVITILGVGLAALQKQVDELLEDLRKVVEGIAAAATHLASELLKAEGEFFAAVDLEAEQVLGRLTVGQPQILRDAALTLLRASLVPLRWQLEIPLTMLRTTGMLLHAAATEQIANGQIDPQQLRQQVRARMLAGSAVPLKIPIVLNLPPFGTIDLGTVSIDSSTLVRTVTDLVMASPAFNLAVEAVAALARQQYVLQVKYLTVDKARQANLTAQHAADQVVAAVQRPAPVINLLTPVEGSQQDGEIGLRLQVINADRSFVSPPLGLPQRVAVRLNGQPVATDPSWWTGDATIELNVALASDASRVVSTLPQPVFFPRPDEPLSVVDPSDPKPRRTFPVWSPRPRVLIGRPGPNSLEVAVAVGDGRTATVARNFVLGPRPFGKVMMLSSARGASRTYQAVRNAGFVWVAHWEDAAHTGWQQATAVRLGPVGRAGVLVNRPPDWTGIKVARDAQPMVVRNPSVADAGSFVVAGDFTYRTASEVVVYAPTDGAISVFQVDETGNLTAVGPRMTGRRPTAPSRRRPAPTPVCFRPTRS